MLFVVGIAAAFAVGLAGGGRIGRLTALRVRWWWAAPIALVVQLLTIYGPLAFDPLVFVALIIGSHLGLLAVALRNPRVPGAALAGVGLAMNLAVMLANGGLMPIAPETLARSGRVESWKIGDGSPGTRLTHSKDVIWPVEATRLEPLADRFWSGLPGRLNVVFSLGDVVLLLGVGTLIVRTMTKPTPTIIPEELDATDPAAHLARQAILTG